MADYQSRRTMMVDTQVRPSDVTKFPIIDALLDIPREEFVPDEARDAAYIGEHLTLDRSRVILEPRLFAKMLDALNIDPEDVVLDVGCGLGYSTAVLAHMAAFVVAVEQNEDWAKEAEANLTAQGVDNAAVFASAMTDGAAQNGPYDVIILQGAVETLPDALLDQLKEGGRIVATFAVGAVGEVRLGHKIDGAINWRMAFNGTAPVLPGFAKEAEFTFE